MKLPSNNFTKLCLYINACAILTEMVAMIEGGKRVSQMEPYKNNNNPEIWRDIERTCCFFVNRVLRNENQINAIVLSLVK